MRAYEFILESAEDQEIIESLATMISEYFKAGGLYDTIGNITGNDGILKDIKVETVDDMPKAQGQSIPTSAAYDPDTRTIIIPITDKNLESELVHELRHALDDIKSGGKFLVGKKTSTPKDDTTDIKKYTSIPLEINARLSQAVREIVKDLKGKNPSIEEITDAIKVEFLVWDISTYYPDRLKDPEYKRLFTRAIKYIKDRV